MAPSLARGTSPLGEILCWAVGPTGRVLHTGPALPGANPHSTTGALAEVWVNAKQVQGRAIQPYLGRRWWHLSWAWKVIKSSPTTRTTVRVK